MKEIKFTVYYCGMSEGLYSDNIMIFKPYDSFSKSFQWDIQNNSFNTISELSELFKNIAKDEGAYITDWFNYKTIYMKTDNELLGLTEDKNIADIFSYFNKETIEFVFFVVGGASFNCEGYLFIIHPDEDIHKNTPHVHVRRDDEETRYYLESLERFPNDKVSRRFLKDEKKRIKPYLLKNKEKLYEYWNLYMNGYTTPTMNEEGKQYYKES